MNGSPKYIRIYFNRDDKFENSDSLKVTPLIDLNQFSISYTIAACDSSTRQKIEYNFVLERDELLGYIDTLLTFVKFDSEPFDKIQFDIPGFPTILVKYDNIQNVKEGILNSIKMLLKTSESWPKGTIPVQVQPTLYYDDDDDESYICL
jgi:hypothetical protein